MTLIAVSKTFDADAIAPVIEAGISQVVTTLYNDALGPAPADTYLGMMRHNATTIERHLR